MTFEDWMRHRGLSERSVRSYHGAIRGVMSQWAMEGGLLEGPLDSIRSHRRFEMIAVQLRALPIYQQRNERGNSMYNSALNKYLEYLAEGFDNDVETDIDLLLAQDEAPVTEKSQMLKTRIGQGAFRQRLIAYWQGCAVTHYQDCAMLVASHIKPWSACSNSERLDHFNGLLLLPNLDKAFDSGFMTFEPTGAIKISPLLKSPSSLGIHQQMGVKLDSKHQSYLQFHRSEVFRAN